MAHVIAVAGKGGVGKTTLCGMLIQSAPGHAEVKRRRTQRKNKRI